VTISLEWFNWKETFLTDDETHSISETLRLREDPRWCTVNVESKRVCCGCVVVEEISALNGPETRTIVTSKKDFILSHLNHFYPLKAVSRLSRPRSMKNLAQSQARLCGICDENIGARTGFPTSTSVTLSVSFHQYSILIHLFIHSSIISPITDSVLHIC